MNEEQNIERQSKGASIEVLTAELSEAINDAEWKYAEMERAYDSLYCQWPGQTTDARKHKTALGYDPFPWEGASDTRVRTVDEVVNEQMMMMCASFRRSRISAVGIESTDLGWGQKVTTILKWMLWSRMRQVIHRETELAARWRQHYGCSIMSIMWDQELRLSDLPLTLADLAELMAAGRPLNPESATLLLTQIRQEIHDPAHEEAVIALLRQLGELVTVQRARRMLSELRESETTTVPMPEIFGGTPRWTALLPFVDVFFPCNTDDIQRARWIMHRELLTESELRNRIKTAGYDEEWVDEVIEHRGSMLVGGRWRWIASERSRSLHGFLLEEKNMIEIFHCYHRVTDENNLVDVWCEVFHPSVKDSVGKKMRMPYDHGLYPYVAHVREHASRSILESRGIAEIADPWQRDIKRQRDARIDKSDIATVPPVIVPPGRGPRDLSFGPGAQWPGRRNESFTWMQPPPFDGTSIEVERSTERSVDRYFGIMSDHNSQQRTQLFSQHCVDGWLIEMQMACVQSLQLMQQFVPEDVIVRVAGSAAQPFRISRKEIQGQFDLMIEFDARDLNAEALKEKLELLNTFVLPNDRMGAIDMNKFVTRMFQSIDPWLADESMSDPETATKREVDEELNAWALMVAGHEPALPDSRGAMNYNLRLQTLQGVIAKNPEVQEMLRSRPLLLEMVGRRMKAFQFQLQQRENAQIGRTGVAAALPNAGGVQ